ncbi:glycogenin glucosyltransferase [Tulasnella sp. 330]|nr:glycogenin glucosyltransferase [Tulasnella sp. 330]KAG8883309.1 glycogenin glucosyltransferase [Tulasnella sp. 331]
MASSPAYAFVTLLTSDSYLPGALALVAALRDVHAANAPTAQPQIPFQTVCLITPENLAVETQATVRKAFDIVVGVDIIREDTSAGLNLLGRPDLALVLTKLHAFRLTQFDKIIFLDADILPVRPLAHLFTLDHEFSAVPDVGWPDIFNSGLMVFQPGNEKFDRIMQLVRTKGSWDGGDQGVLNEWRGGHWNRLSFTYNTTPTAAYTYAPAYERFGKEINAIHFIGTNKPWKSLPWRAPGSGAAAQVTEPVAASSPVQPSYGYHALVDKWFNVYDQHYRPTFPSGPQRQEMGSQAPFQLPTYVSAWNQPRSKRPSEDLSGATSSAMGLDELKTLNIGGLGVTGPGSNGSQGLPYMGIGYVGPSMEQGDAQYITMPMPGRTQLLDYHDRPVDEPLERPIPYNPEPSEGPPQSQGPEGFQEPPDWAPPATATSSPPAHLFRPRSNYPNPDFDQRHHDASRSHASPVPPPQSNDLRAHGGDLGGRHHYRRPHHHHQPQQHHHRNYHHSTAPPLEKREQHDGPSQKGQGQQGQEHHRQHSHTPHQEPSSQWHSYQQHSHPLPEASPSHQDANVTHHQEEGRRQRRDSWWDDNDDGYDTESHYALKREATPRPRSPPMMTWNPAVEPPPDDLPPGAYNHPETPHFTNVWDRPQHLSRIHQLDYTYNSDSSPPTRDAYLAPESQRGDFFRPPTIACIPSQLVQEGHYSALISQNPQPDKRKVSKIFPWEGKARPIPSRVFPRSDTSPSGLPQNPEVPPGVPAGYRPSLVNVQRTSFPGARPPAQSLPSDGPPLPRATRRFSYDWQAQQASSVGPGAPKGHGNVWDTVPSIQKYVTKLVKPSSLLGGALSMKQVRLDPGSPGKAWSEKLEESDAASHEADDEDDESDLDDGRGSGGGSGYTSPRSGGGKRGGKSGRSGSGKNSPIVRPGSSRRGSEQTVRASTAEKGIMTNISGSGKASGTPKYRSQSVQTVPKETQTRGVQVNRPSHGTTAFKRYRNTSMETSSASVSPMDKRIPLPTSSTVESGLLLETGPAVARPKRDTVVTFAPTPTITPTPSAPSEKQMTPPVTTEPFLKMHPFVPQKHSPSTPTVTTPATASETYRTYPFSRARYYSPTTPTSSNRDSTTYTPTTSNRDSLLSIDTIATPQSSIIFPTLPAPAPHIRTSSNETGLTVTSPPTSDAPKSPADDEALGTSARMVPSGRHWDPRRNVDIFKSQSQDVLARFLSMGSWESQDPQKQQQ